ncbi:MAG: right-handed parallel beta-helix repeat-containing protein [Pirellulales bacterium]
MHSPLAPRLLTMRRAAATTVAGIALLLLARECAAAEPGPAVDFYVAVNGDDANPGTLDQPFATLRRARDAVREAKRAQPKPAGVTVHFRGGTYFLPGMFNILAHDTGLPDLPVTYRSFADERAMLVAGRDVGGFTAVPDKPGLLVADLPVPKPDIVPLTQVFHIGPQGWERLTRARYPNVDPRDPIGGGWARAVAAISGTAAKPGDETKSLAMAEGDWRKWTRGDEGVVHVFAAHDWWNSMVRVASRDEALRALRFHDACSLPVQPGDRYFIEGLFEDLDAPGEWFYDKLQGKLFVRPPRDVAPADFGVVAPNARSIITLGPHVQNVTLERLTFHGCEGTAVFLLEATKCTVKDCTIAHVGGYHGSGVAIVGGKDNLVTGCEISNTGGPGIVLAGGRLDRRERAGHRAEQNVVHHPGVICKHGVGIGLGGFGSTAARNLIHDCPRSGIILTGNEHVVELNRVERTCLETNEAAAISAEGADFVSGRGNVVRHNHVRDSIGFGRDADGTWRSPAIAWGISLDHGAVGVDVIGNIVERGGRAGIRLDNARHCRIDNNLLVDAGTDAQVEYDGWSSSDDRWLSRLPEMKLRHDVIAKAAPWKDVPHLAPPPADAVLPDGTTSAGNEFTRNIVVWSNPTALLFRMKNLPLGHYRSDTNLVWPTAAGKPGVPRVVVEPSWPKEAAAPPADRSFAAWKQLGFDAASLVADPKLPGSATGDFRLGPDSPAATIGFEELPLDTVGPATPR